MVTQSLILVALSMTLIMERSSSSFLSLADLTTRPFLPSSESASESSESAAPSMKREAAETLEGCFLAASSASDFSDSDSSSEVVPSSELELKYSSESLAPKRVSSSRGE